VHNEQVILLNREGQKKGTGKDSFAAKGLYLISGFGHGFCFIFFRLYVRFIIGNHKLCQMHDNIYKLNKQGEA
jgi:hypothetical protein